MLHRYLNDSVDNIPSSSAPQTTEISTNVKIITNISPSTSDLLNCSPNSSKLVSQSQQFTSLVPPKYTTTGYRQLINTANQSGFQCGKNQFVENKKIYVSHSVPVARVDPWPCGRKENSTENTINDVRCSESKGNAYSEKIYNQTHMSKCFEGVAMHQNDNTPMKTYSRIHRPKPYYINKPTTNNAFLIQHQVPYEPMLLTTNDQTLNLTQNNVYTKFNLLAFPTHSTPVSTSCPRLHSKTHNGDDLSPNLNLTCNVGSMTNINSFSSPDISSHHFMNGIRAYMHTVPEEPFAVISHGTLSLPSLPVVTNQAAALHSSGNLHQIYAI